VKRKVLEQVLSSIYGEQEIEYLLRVVKSTHNLSEETDQPKKPHEEMLSIFEKGLDTLEVLMRKLGF
jgi:cystathionine beta-lyase family protein involved in aluminum resistance